MSNNVRLHLKNGIIVEGPPEKVAELVGDVPSLNRRGSYYRGWPISSMSNLAIRNKIIGMVHSDLLEMGQRKEISHFLEGSTLVKDPIFEALIFELRKRETASPGQRFSEDWEL